MNYYEVNSFTLMLNQQYLVVHDNKSYTARYLGMNNCNNILTHMFVKDDQSIILIPFVTYQYRYYYHTKSC